jgi:hypothetical protein
MKLKTLLLLGLISGGVYLLMRRRKLAFAEPVSIAVTDKSAFAEPVSIAAANKSPEEKLAACEKYAANFKVGAPIQKKFTKERKPCVLHQFRRGGPVDTLLRLRPYIEAQHDGSRYVSVKVIKNETGSGF